jgi:glyceraldehyde 3-phosphate dehydrogenase
MGIKIAINGFGRIGRNVLKAKLNNKNKYQDLEIVAINDLTDAKTLAHLFKYDSVFGVFSGEVKGQENEILVNKQKIKVYSERDPKNLPWGDDGVDVVIESTGLFRTREKAKTHLEAGAKKVIISAPAKDEDITIVLGVNQDNYQKDKDHIISNASCTTNCLAPVAKVLNDNFTINKGIMNTIHSYTNDQVILDAPHSDLRRARAAAVSMIPTTTGAAKAVTLVIPELKGKLDGSAIRVPTPNVSVVDFVCTVDKKTNKEEVNEALKTASQDKFKGIIQFCEEELVSIDFLGSSYSSIVDGPSTNVLDNNLVRILSWYDNEWGYSTRILDLIKEVI